MGQWNQLTEFTGTSGLSFFPSLALPTEWFIAVSLVNASPSLTEFWCVLMAAGQVSAIGDDFPILAQSKCFQKTSALLYLNYTSEPWFPAIHLPPNSIGIGELIRLSVYR